MSDDQWEEWQFLLGDWVGEGSGEPGEGTAFFSFYPDLEQNVLVRRNHVDYPATPSKPAWFHEDLLIVYTEPERTVRAIYFDNEGHVIRYAVENAHIPGSVIFISEAAPGMPRFRLSYIENPDRSLTILFEIASPGEPDNFAVYTKGSARRK